MKIIIQESDVLASSSYVLKFQGTSPKSKHIMIHSPRWKNVI